MKIKILSEEKLETLSTKENLDVIEKYIKDNSTNEWLKDIFKVEEPFTLSKVDMEDFEMDMSAERPEDTDFENAKRLFEALKHLSESTACDTRLWAGLTFGKFYSYMQYRYNLSTNNKYFKNKWLFQGQSRKADLFRQGISMLWWYVYLTYDDSLENPYELTEFCFKHKDFLISIYSRTYSGSKNVRLALIQALRDYERDGGSIEKKEIYNGIVKYVSFLGGAYLVDVFSREELYEKFYDELIRLETNLNNKTTNRFSLSD